MSANVFLSLSISCPRVSWPRWPRFLPGLLIGSSSWCLGTVDLPRRLQDCAPGPGGPTAAAQRGAAVRSARQLGGSGGLAPGVPPAPLALPPGPSSPCRSPGPGWEAADGLGPCGPAPLAEGGPRCPQPAPLLSRHWGRGPHATRAGWHRGIWGQAACPLGRGERVSRGRGVELGAPRDSPVPQALAWASACPAGL